MVPINYTSDHVKDCAAWRGYGRRIGLRAPDWRKAAGRYALQHGKAIVFHCDDSATIFERDESRKQGFRRASLPASSVFWHDDWRKVPADIGAR